MTFFINDDFDPESTASRSGEVDYTTLDDFDLMMLMAQDPRAAEEFVKRHAREIGAPNTVRLTATHTLDGRPAAMIGGNTFLREDGLQFSKSWHEVHGPPFIEIPAEEAGRTHLTVSKEAYDRALRSSAQVEEYEAMAERVGHTNFEVYDEDDEH